MSKLQKYTPAPWVMKRTDNDMEDTGLIMGADGMKQVCDTGVAYWYNAQARGVKDLDPVIAQCEADAKLIQAAPDMADVLHKQIDALEPVIEILDRFAPDSTAARILHTLIDVDMAVLVKAGVL